ncbi:MAG: DUF2235 domain-containing protein [Hyphomicrobiaceae bacterium]|nr:DUF2235 domain-containing protein [Hyphomicrobiaceae bacterium]
MPKNIVILCDGTSNEISHDRTNILRLHGCLKKNNSQIVFYDPGVGTFGAEHSPFAFRRKAAEVWGLATGWGLDKNVKDAYRFLVDHYDHGEKDEHGKRQSDEIIIYGFSRGAYTARVLAGFIHTLGLLHPNQMNLLDYAYRAYKGISDRFEDQEDGDGPGPFAEVRLYERALKPTRPTISFLGLFDTVASVLESGKRGYRFRSHAFTANNRSVAAVRHAVALDERRTMFQPMLWPLGQTHRPDYWVKQTEIPQDADEQWFRGTHGDIGGGWPERQSALAKIPLAWMIEESKKFGIAFETRSVNQVVLGKTTKAGPSKYQPPNTCATVNKSMTGFWPILEYFPRRRSIHVRTNRTVIGGLFIPRKERRIVPSDAKIHPSVYDCDQLDVASLHPNLPETNGFT